MVEIPKFRVTVVILIFFVSTGYVMYFLFSFFRSPENDSVVQGLQSTCPPQPLCESDLVEESTSDSSTSSSSESSSTVHVCGIVRMHDIKAGRFPEDQLVVDVLGRRFFYHFIHVYGKGDIPPTDKNRRHLMLETDKAKSTYKFLKGMEYYETVDHPCDMYFYVQDDVTLNFILLSFILNKAEPSSWIGSYIEKRDMKNDAAFKKMTGEEIAKPHFRDPFFVMGGTLGKCVLKEIQETYLEKGWADIVMGEYYAMGNVAEKCEKKTKNVHHVFMCAESGYSLNNARKPTGDGYLLIQMKFPARKDDTHISQLL